MKPIKLFILGIMVACFIQACNVKSKTEPLEYIVINGQKSCYVPYELNPLNTNDTINRMFYDGTKLGHWIVFQWVTPKGESEMSTAKKHGRVKLEEGNYENGEKEGFWKSYRKDGTLRDSTEYIHGIPGC